MFDGGFDLGKDGAPLGIEPVEDPFELRKSASLTSTLCHAGLRLTEGSGASLHHRTGGSGSRLV